MSLRIQSKFKMIDRKGMVLEQVSIERYLELKSAILNGVTAGALEKRLEGSELKPYGFAEITKPIIYGSYYQLLESAKECDFVKKASVRKKEYEQRVGGRFFVVQREYMDLIKIKELAERANEKEILWLAFLWRKQELSSEVNNEILFQLIYPKKQVVSRFIEIPGEERDLYAWHGDEKKYLKIFGILPNLTR